MRIALVILIGVHVLIHLFGFLQAFGITEFNAINESISKTSGVFWLVAFLLLITTLVLIIIRSDYWWTCGLVASITSQILIIHHWSDTKFGTMANMLILFAAVVAYSNYNFKNFVKKETVSLLDKSQKIQETIVSIDDLSALPPVIQKWLKNSGIVGKPIVSNVYLTQELKLKLKPEQNKWHTGSAEQYFTVQPPAFSWNLNTSMNPILSIAGRDKFENGKGEMLIKLLSLIPVADAKNNKKIDQATMQRYLAEIVWFPSASLSSYIKWEDLGMYSARATMQYGGITGTGVFHFDENGQFKKFVSMRFKDTDDTESTEWTVSASKTEERNGIKIPTECVASWRLNSEQWTWLKLKIRQVEYNVLRMPEDGGMHK